MYEKISASEFAQHMRHDRVLRKTFSAFHFERFVVRFSKDACGGVSYWIRFTPPELAGAILPRTVGAERGPSFQPASEGDL